MQTDLFKETNGQLKHSEFYGCASQAANLRKQSLQTNAVRKMSSNYTANPKAELK
jgi:hypothetical protein